MSNPIAQLIIIIQIPSKEAKADIKMHPVIPETKIGTTSMQFTAIQRFLCFYCSIHCALFLQGNNFLFHLYF